MCNCFCCECIIATIFIFPLDPSLCFTSHYYYAAINWRPSISYVADHAGRLMQWTAASVCIEVGHNVSYVMPPLVHRRVASERGLHLPRQDTPTRFCYVDFTLWLTPRRSISIPFRSTPTRGVYRLANGQVCVFRVIATDGAKKCTDAWRRYGRRR